MMKQRKITQKYTLEDIIADEVKKQAIRTVVPDSGGFSLDSLSDITKLLVEVNKLVDKMGNKQQSPAPVLRDDSARISKEDPGDSKPAPAPAGEVDYDAMVDKILSAFDAIIIGFGDIPLSEARGMIEKEREAVKELIRGEME